MIDSSNCCQETFTSLLANIRKCLIMIFVTIPVQKNLIVIYRNRYSKLTVHIHHMLCAIHYSQTILMNHGRNHINGIQIFTITIVTILIKRLGLLNKFTFRNRIANFKGIHIRVIISRSETFLMFHQLYTFPCMINLAILIITNDNIVVRISLELRNNLIITIAIIQHRRLLCQNILKARRNQRNFWILNIYHMSQLMI